MGNKIQDSLKQMVKDNDAVVIALGNYTEKGDLTIEFAVNASEDELFSAFVELFTNSEIKDEARKAILFSDYGKKDADRLTLN